MNAKEILKRTTFKQRIELCSGKNFWQTKELEDLGIPSLFMCDGPHGLRKQELSGSLDMLGVNKSLPATCFPTAVTLASSWDTSLIERVGEAIGEEAAAGGVGLVLGPGANIKRSPLCGRNFEYFSEDPYISGKIAAAFIRGLQKNGTAACLKHFAFNNQEFGRFNSDSVIDERTMREIYLSGFETAVKEGSPASVMCAYNKVNGVHCSDNKKLLTDILRKEWGFKGVVVTDWGAMNDRIEGFRAGCDLNMPGGSEYMEKEVYEAVKTGKLDKNAVNASAYRVLRLIIKQAERFKRTYRFDQKAHHELAREAAEQGAVLLKNEGILPLDKSAKVSLFGAMTIFPRYQGSGSSHINPFYVVSPLDAMPECGWSAGCDENGDTTEQLLSEAVNEAKKTDIAVIFAGLPDKYESEGFDRENMKMPDGHIRLIEAVSAVNPNTVVVLCCGSAVECPWADKVKGILYMGLGGEAVGEAAADLLCGRVNPSGKLTESWAYKYNDYAVADYYSNHKNAQYREGIYVGYRYFDKAGVKTRFPFGYGLSYTTFKYSDLKVGRNAVSVTVTNTGETAGAEVVQLYVSAPQDGIHRPIKELKGFSKVFLAPGESKSVEIPLDKRSFAVWADGWRVPSGVYTVFVGSSSADPRLSKKINITGDDIRIPEWQKGSWYETPNGSPSKVEWEIMLGREYHDKPVVKGKFTMDDSISEMKESSLIMRVMYKAIQEVVAKQSGSSDSSDPVFRMTLSAAAGPLRCVQISGGIKGGLIPGILDIANGNYINGLKKIVHS